MLHELREMRNYNGSITEKQIDVQVHVLHSLSTWSDAKWVVNDMQEKYPQDDEVRAHNARHPPAS